MDIQIHKASSHLQHVQAIQFSLGAHLTWYIELCCPPAHMFLYNWILVYTMEEVHDVLGPYIFLTYTLLVLYLVKQVGP